MPLTPAEEQERSMLMESLGLTPSEETERALIIKSLQESAIDTGAKISAESPERSGARARFEAYPDSTLERIQTGVLNPHLDREIIEMQRQQEALHNIGTGSTAIEIGATGGAELLGRVLTARFGPGVQRATGAAFSTGALYLKRLISGEPVDVGDLSLEFGMSYGFAGGLEGSRNVAQKVASTTTHGRRAASDYLGQPKGKLLNRATRAKATGFIPELAERGFPDLTVKADAERLSKLARQSGFQIAPDAFRKELRKFKNSEMEVIKEELARRVNTRHYPRLGIKSGERFEFIRNQRVLRDTRGLDIGALAQIRSDLSQALFGNKIKHENNRETIQEFVDLLTDAIDNGPVFHQGKLHNGQTGRELLLAARAAHDRLFRFNRMTRLINKNVIKPDPSGKHVGVDLRSLIRITALDPETAFDLTKAEKQAVLDLAREPTLKSEISELLRVTDSIDFSTTAISRLQVAEFVAWLVGAGPMARMRAARIITSKTGKRKLLTPTDLVIMGFSPARTLIRSDVKETLQGSPL